MIIDFHTHTFPESVAHKAMEGMSHNGHVDYFSDATVNGLASSMAEAGIDLSVNLPVMTRPDQVEKVNSRLLEQKDDLVSRGILTFGGMHPRYSEPRKELARLAAAGVKGIKLHPAFQGVQVNDPDCKRIIGAASELGLIVLVHCGMDVGFPDHNWAPVADLLEVIREVRPEKLVLAHMGGWQGWEDVKRDLAGAPVWLDTAYSLGPVYPRPGEEDRQTWKENLSGEAFAELVRAHGTDRVLFGTDSPWAKQKEYLELLRAAPLNEDEQSAILGGNAEKLLGL